MNAIIKTTINQLIRIFPEWICKREYERQAFKRFNERPVEYEFVFRVVRDHYPKNVLDVGTGTTALPSLLRACGCLVTATDNIADYWPSGMFNRHYFVKNDNIASTTLTGKYDLITCISVLEHIEDSDSAMRNMLSLLHENGCLVVSFPYTEKSYVKNVYCLPNSSYGQNAKYITQSYSRDELNRWLDVNHAKIIEQEYWQFWDGDYWTVGNQDSSPSCEFRG